MKKPQIPPAHLRQEIFSLGGRNSGDAIGGAKRELKDLNLPTKRRKLLEAVVSHLEGGASEPSPVAGSKDNPVGHIHWREFAYGAILISSMMWAGSVLVRLVS